MVAFGALGKCCEMSEVSGGNAEAHEDALHQPHELKELDCESVLSPCASLWDD